MWKTIKADLKERFLNFEAFNGGFIFIPWGSGFIYYGIYKPQFSYQYGMVSVGLVLIVWGLRKLFTNRIKLQAKINKLVMNREFKEGSHLS